MRAKHSEAHRANDAVHQLAVHKLQSKIAENEHRLADPQVAYQEHQARNAELEQLLKEATTDIGGNRIKDAQIAMDGGDYSKADDIFAEVEQLEQEAVKRAARAAYGRGLVAEEQVRWTDAATHYSKAARLDPTYDTLIKAGVFLWRAGQHKAAIKTGEELVDLAMRDYGDADPKTATAMNNLATSYNAAGDYAAAEPLYRQALDIDAKTIGTDHPDYATHLNNLALLLEAMEDYAAAEPLFQQAVSVSEVALGAEHSQSKTLRTNLEKFLRDKP